MSTAVGVDIGSRNITVAELRSAREGARITNFGGIELPPGAVREGEILDPGIVSERLTQLISDAGIKQKKVWLGVANQRVVVRQVDLPWMEEDDLRASLRYQVQEYIPIPVDEAELDVHVVEEVASEEGDRRLRVLLVAGHTEMIRAHVDAVRFAGLKPIGVDLAPFAILRAMGDTTMLESGSQVLIDIGANVTNIVIHRGMLPSFVRILVLGGEAITAAVADRLGISSDEADVIKREVTVGFGSEPAALVVTEQAEVFIDEIRSSLDYYRAQPGAEKLAGVVLTGGGAMLPGLAQRLADAIRLPVELGNPFSRYPAPSTVYDAAQLAAIGPVMAGAIGLGLGGLE